jgi:hypothetical protein
MDMSQSADAVRNGLVLRFTLPASGELRAIASELAAKVADQFGVTGQGEGGLAATLEELARRVSPSNDGDLAFEFHKMDRELKLEARSDGRASETRIPLPA